MFLYLQTFCCYQLNSNFLDDNQIQTYSFVSIIIKIIQTFLSNLLVSNYFVNEAIKEFWRLGVQG